MDDINKKLEELPENERKIALEILKEYSEKGKSDIYNSLIYEDYREIPVDIETFLTDDRYLGIPSKTLDGKSKVYPFWMEKLKQLYPDNIHTSVNTFIASGARGLGKSETCVNYIMCYELYRDMCLKNPLDYYHLKKTDKVVYALMNIKLALAEEIAIDKFQNTVKQSPWFMERGYLTGRTTKIWQPNDDYMIDIKIGSQSDDLIGLPVRFCFFDEVSFQRNQDIDKQKQKAIDMIDTALGGMLTRFMVNGKNKSLLCLASSKRSDKSFLEEHIKTKLASEPDNVMIIDEPVWNVKPEGTYSKEKFTLAVGNKFLVSQIIEDDKEFEYIKKGYTIIHPPVSLKAQFLDDMDRALCDFAGISSTELSKYISGTAVNDCINKQRKNPFTKDIIEVGNDKEDKLQYQDFFDLSLIDKDMMLKPLFVHLDMSISGDMTGIAGAWIKGKKPSEDKDKQANDLFFQLAFSVSVKAPKGRQVSFEKNRNFIRWLRDQGFNVKEITTDAFQSYDLRQQLQAEGFNVSMLSVDRVGQNHICEPYQFFKNVIYEQRVDMYESKTLIEEIINLERNINTGKVDHPEGFRKDVCDAFCGSIYTASKYAEEYAYNYGETYDILIGSNVDTNMTNSTFKQQRQMIVNFEDMLKEADPVRQKMVKENKEDIQQIYISNDTLIW